MALSWLNLPCALKAAIVSESGHLATLATDRLPRSRGRGKARATAPSPRHLTRHRRERWGEGVRADRKAGTPHPARAEPRATSPLRVAAREVTGFTNR